MSRESNRRKIADELTMRRSELEEDANSVVLCAHVSTDQVVRLRRAQQIANVLLEKTATTDDIWPECQVVTLTLPRASC